MKIVNMRFMAMLVLGFLAAATKALTCPSPPAPATRAWVEGIRRTMCTVVLGDLHLGRRCTAPNVRNTCVGENLDPLEGAVDLEDVETITGELTCWGNPGITTVTANSLTNAGAVQIRRLADVSTDNDLLTGFSFPALVNVSGSVGISGNDALTSVGLGALQTIEGYIFISGNDVLASVGLGALQTVGGVVLRISTNPALTSVGLGALQTVGSSTSLYIRDNANPLDIEVNAKSPLLGCASGGVCTGGLPGAVLTIEGFSLLPYQGLCTGPSSDFGSGSDLPIGYIFDGNVTGYRECSITLTQCKITCSDTAKCNSLSHAHNCCFLYEASHCPQSTYNSAHNPAAGYASYTKIRAPTTMELEIAPTTMELEIAPTTMELILKAWLERMWQNMPWASTKAAAGVEARTQTPFTTEANSAPTQAPLATEASSAPSCISFSLVLVPILAVWAMVVQA